MKNKKDAKKKQNRRSKVKYPALDPEYNIKIRHEVIDYDYLDQLNEEELKWLNDFSKEYINAAVGRQKDDGQDNRFHRSKQEVKDCQDRNNARNACVYGKAKAMHRLAEMNKDSIREITERVQQDPEELYVSLIDLKKLHSSRNDSED